MIKSVLLGSVAVGMTVFATAASAQSPRLVSQNITPQLSQQATTNEAVVLQRNNDNTATIDQSGSLNKAGDINGTVNLSMQNINTTNGDALADRANTILQYGDHNGLTVTQAGSNNQIVTTNNNRQNSFNTAAYEYGSFQGGSYNKMDVYQRGDNSKAQFQQLNSGNTGSIDQQSGTDKNYAGVFQWGGSNNEGRVYQNAGTSDSSGQVAQSGSNNKGFVSQYGKTQNGGVGQSGDNNYGQITQAGMNQDALILQYSNNNKGYITQNGGNTQQAFITQTSNDNTASIYQGAGTSNYAAILQDTAFNNATINQTGSTNFAAAYQVGGANNTTTIQQDGSGIGAFSYQNGAHNTSAITQYNTATSANAGVIQYGAYNSATIRQR